MATHGVEAGPHIVLHLLGPSNFRDATGTLATSLANPLPLAVGAGQGFVKYFDNEKELKSIREDLSTAMSPNGKLIRATARRKSEMAHQVRHP